MSFRFELCFFQSVHGLCKIAYVFLHCVVSDKFCVVLSFLIWQNRRIFASIINDIGQTTFIRHPVGGLARAVG